MQEALATVRREFGPEAVILNTREAFRSRLWPWSRHETEVEVTAGRGVTSTRNESRSPAISTAHLNGPRVAGADNQYGSASSIATQSLPRATSQPRTPPTIQGLGGTQTVLNTTQRNSPSSNGATVSDLGLQVQSLQNLLQQLTARLDPDRAAIPPELFDTYTRLIDAEVPEETARGLIGRLTREFPRPAWSAGDQVSALLSGIVERDLHCSGAIRTLPGRRKVVALVGPTGVGKTTTIAKLAANFKLRAGLRVGLVTVDTYRIAAVDQLRTYAEIIDIPMQVVSRPREMSRVLSEMSDLDLVLIDTAGRSPADDLQLQELKSLLAEGCVDEVHLVLSLAASTRSLISTARQFSAVRTTSMILTKLDESPGLGQLLAALAELPAPISYLTTGQNVPDDIEPAVAARLARLVLGLESLRV